MKPFVYAAWYVNFGTCLPPPRGHGFPLLTFTVQLGTNPPELETQNISVSMESSRREAARTMAL